MTQATVTVCVLLAQGVGGGALSCLPAGRQRTALAALPHSPEKRIGDPLRHTPLIVVEHPDAAQEPEAFCPAWAGNPA